MSQISALEVAVIVKELSEYLPCKILNIYQFKNIFNIKLRCLREKRNLLIEPSQRIYFSNVEYEWKATTSAMFLRRHIRNKTIHSVKQVNFDRVVRLEISDNYSLIVELLSRGNLILLKDNRIVFSTNYVEMKDRVIKPGVPYTPPPSQGLNLFTTEETQIVDYLKKFDMPIKGLIRLGIGKKYAKWVLEELNIDEKTKSTEIGEEKWMEIAETLKLFLKKILEGDLEPCVYFEDSKVIDFSLFALPSYKNYRCKKFSSLNEALDYYYSIADTSITTTDAFKEEIERLKNRIKKQEELVESYKKKAIKYREVAEKIFEHISEIDSLISSIRYARKELNLSWEEIANKIEEGKKKGVKEALYVKRILKDGRIILDVDGYSFEVNINSQASKLAEEYFEKAKKMEKKIQRASVELEKSKKELQKLLEGAEIEKEKEKIIIKQPKTQWYHRFRWFISSTGHLVIAGKDAESNESIVKNYMDTNDIFLHAEIHGGAATVIKSGRENLSQQTLKEAAIFAASYSSAWKKGLSAVDVFWCYPEEVSLTPPSGLYLPKGSFIIKKKNFIKNVPLELAIGVIIDQLDEFNYTYQLVSGPVKAVKKQTNLYVVLIPGKFSKSEIAKLIKKKLLEYIGNENLAWRKIIEKLDINKIIEIIPGPSDIVRVDEIDE